MKPCLILLGIVCLLTAACGPATTSLAPPGSPAMGAHMPLRGGTLRVALQAEPITLDPHFVVPVANRRVIHALYDPLVRLAKDLTLQPELAEKWEYPDPTTLVLTLRKGVKFHDGTDFNAQAVKLNFERMLDPANNSPRRSDVAGVKELQVVDDHTIKLMLKAPNAALLAALSDMAGMMISPAAIQKYGKDLARNPVGTGPFQFAEWVKDDHLSVKRFDGYWEKGADGEALPYLAGVLYKPVTDATVQLTALKAGAVDIIDSVNAPAVPALRDSKDPILAEVAGLGWIGFYLQTARPPFDRKEVRQAFAWALDREAVARTLAFNTLIAGEQPIPPSSWAHAADIAPYQRDVSKSRALLQSAGLTLPVKITCIMTNLPFRSQHAQVWKEQLSDAGFDMSIELLEAGVLLDRFTRSDFQCAYDGWSGRPDPDGNTYGHLHSLGSLNLMHYANPRVDELLDKGRSTYDQAQRRQLYSDAMRIVADDAPMVVTAWFRPAVVYTARLQNFVLIPDGILRFKAVWLAP